MGRYNEAYGRSISDPNGFWGDAAEALHWDQRWDRVLDDSRPPFYRWFRGGKLNTCFNAVDRHVDAGRGDQAAIIYDSPVTGTVRRTTYAELKEQVARFGGVLQSLGVAPGDRVIIYMPMIPEALVAMLACARIGAVHSVVFGGFASNELASRIDDATPKVIVAASCGIEVNRVIPYMPLLNGAIELAGHKPDACVILARPEAKADLKPGLDVDWQEAAAAAVPVDCVPMLATDPLYILYTSGTTGTPKGIVRDTGGHAVALHWSMTNIYDVQPGEVWWTASDVGWVVGHSYICYAPLLHGNTTIVYEGKPVGTPDAGAFWRVISDHKAVSLFTAPTAFRAIRKEDPTGALISRQDLSHFRTLFLAGERCDPDTLSWAEEKLQCPVIDHWWQTETGWAIGANCRGIEPLPVKPGSPTKAVPGYDIQVLDEDGNDKQPGEIGNISIKLPLPPGTLPTIWQNEQRCFEAYFSRYDGYYLTGDAGYIDEDGYLFIMSRIDDVINVAGHRLSTGAMEEVLASHKDVAECAVFGVVDQLKGELPLGLVVLNAGNDRSEADLQKELIRLVRETIGPVAAFKLVAVVDRLPKTRSGKILRGTMKCIADSKAYKMPATIDDPVILPEIKTALKRLGYALS